LAAQLAGTSVLTPPALPSQAILTELLHKVALTRGRSGGA
jgi:hypothetical protein